MPTYNGVKYDKNIDYAKLMNDAEAAGDLSAAKSYEQARNAKILGEGMAKFSTTNKYQNTDTNGSAAGDGSKSDTSKAPSYDSKWSDKLNEILGSYEEAIKAPSTSIPSYTAPSYNPQYDAEIDGLLNKLLNREPFEYNEELDPLYQQYKDMYTKQGQLAMEDTMGQAAALTGGYGSTYSQAVGQQMYNAYLGKVQEMLPEFYDRAYGQYQDEGSNIKDLYNMYVNRDQLDFQRYQQEVANAEMAYQAAAATASMAYQQQQDNISNLGNLYGLVSGADATDYERFLNNWNMNNTLDQQEYNRLIDKWNQDMQLNESNYNRRQDTQKLAQSQIDAIIAAGGTPSQALISASGYDPSYINSLMSYYQQQAAAQSSGRSSGGGGGSSKKKTTAEPTITNRNGNGWVYVPGLGRMTYYELESKVNSGEVKETKNKKANTITYSKKQ